MVLDRACRKIQYIVEAQLLLIVQKEGTAVCVIRCWEETKVTFDGKANTAADGYCDVVMTSRQANLFACGVDICLKQQ